MDFRSALISRSFRPVPYALIAYIVLPVGYAQTVASMACSPAVIAGGTGGSATCTVTLSAAAPPAGTVVSLTSSQIELAASLPLVTVPAGQTAANFTVTTNARYRLYSLLAFSVDIRASANGTARSATLNVTAQPRPPDFNSSSQAGSNTQWQGAMCGGIAPIGGFKGILYQCSPATGTGFGSCTFRQECTIGCRRVPPSNGTFNDFCATTGPNPVAISRNYVVGGDRVSATVITEAPAGSAPAHEQGIPGVVDPNFNSIHFPQVGIQFPDGATTVGFDVATSYVPSIQFASATAFWFNDAIPPLLITNGRAGHAWLVMLPPEPPPAVAVPTLGDFKITGLNPVRGGQGTIGQVDISGLSRVVGPTITLTSSHPDIVPPTTINAPASEQFFGFQVPISTRPPAVDTDVLITATDGRYSFNANLRVLVPPPAPVLAAVSVNPTTVVGGNPATGTVTLSAPQGGPTVIALSTPVSSTVATMPSSITVPAGAISASFPISTLPVSETFFMNVFADLAGSPGRQALLLITPGSAPSVTLSALSLSPTSLVGGTSSTGTVTLSGPSPSGGTTVTLSENSSATTVPSSVVVPAGAMSVSFAVTTTAVTSPTSATISSVFAGVSRTAVLTVNPSASPTPTAPNLTSPANDATVAQPVLFDWNDVANATSYEIQVDDSSTIAAPFRANQIVNVSQVAIGGLPAQRLWWKVRARNSSGVWGPFSSVRRFTARSAPSMPALSSMSLSPSTVAGGNGSTGTVTLSSAAPSGGATVLLSSSATAATVPASVILTPGATSAGFAVTTSTVGATTSATITAVYSGITRTATLTINPSGQAPQTATLTISATGRSGERVTSAPTGINVAVGSAGSASFSVGTAITLRTSNNRDAIWSGACSSGGQKIKTCMFTLNGNASIAANVQ